MKNTNNLSAIEKFKCTHCGEYGDTVFDEKTKSLKIKCSHCG
jgi:DNA-directed RNA polymerase subunit RPC12/RpoP